MSREKELSMFELFDNNPYNNTDTSVFALVFVLVIAIILIALFFRFVPVGLWITAYFSGAKAREQK